MVERFMAASTSANLASSRPAAITWKAAALRWRWRRCGAKRSQNPQFGSGEVALKIGVLGLGTGSLTAIGGPADEFVFYEINPLVESLANRYFSYISRSRPASSVLVGDARILLEKELTDRGPRRFDVLIMDAFTSDSIPAHLVTQEAFDIYQQHLNHDGILVFHITNRFIDLRPVLSHAAMRNELEKVLVNHRSSMGSQTRWVLMSRDPSSIDTDRIAQAESDWPTNGASIEWTDDSASLVRIIDWSFRVRLRDRGRVDQQSPVNGK